MEAHIGRAFAEGQVYVALSRATTSDGLRVVGFEQWRVKTNKLAKTFYDNL
jgi:ATP-dependent DNA helicase PIF1